MSQLSQFSRTQAERFQRHFALAGFGIDAQARLLNARVLVVGAGGLGSPILTYLAAAGVGHIEVVDHDVVDRSNLHRQVIHSESTLGQPKTASAAEVMRGLHPEVHVTEHRSPVTATNALDLVSPVDLVVDGSDNFATRYVVSDACEITGTPLISGSILRFAGQLSMFWSAPSQEHWNPAWDEAGRGPTYRDLYPEAPDPGEVPTCAEAGVLGVLPAVVGSMMATEAIKFLAGIGETLLGRVVVYDALTSTVREFGLSPDPDRDAVTEIGEDVAGLGGGPTAVPHPEDDDAATAAATDQSSASEQSPAETEPAASEEHAEKRPAQDTASDEPDIDFNPFTGEPIQADDLTPRQFRAALSAGDLGGIIDVREPWEHEQGAVEQAVNIPLMDLWQMDQQPASLSDSSPEHPVVVYCAHGVRSRQALALLNQRYPEAHVRNLLGGYELLESS